MEISIKIKQAKNGYILTTDGRDNYVARESPAMLLRIISGMIAESVFPEENIEQVLSPNNATVSVHYDKSGGQPIPDGVRVTTADEDFVIALHDLGAYYDTYAEAETAVETAGVSIPSKKQASLICAYLDAINEALVSVGGDTIATEEYITSTAIKVEETVEEETQETETETETEEETEETVEMVNIPLWLLDGSEGALVHSIPATARFRVRSIINGTAAPVETSVTCDYIVEKDPVFMASPAATITEKDLAQWRKGLASVRDALADYTETDPVFKASPAYAITNELITSWTAKAQKIHEHAIADTVGLQNALNMLQANIDALRTYVDETFETKAHLTKDVLPLYYTQTEVDTTLESYATTAAVNETLVSYMTSTNFQS